MSHVRVWIHFVWATKNREPYLVEEIRPRVFTHIRENAREKKIFLAEVGGYLDHLHCLVSLGRSQTIDDVARLIKGESSHWINKNSLTRLKFGWQDDYFAASVCEPALEQVMNYIRNQSKHHQRMNFDEEYEMFLRRTGYRIGDWCRGG